jgi:hypothetical protein
VKNTKPDVEYRFTICNFLKTESLYNFGMMPLIYSEADASKKGMGWRRCGANIKYYRNNIRSEDENGNARSLYSLTWTCRFANENDTYYFAHCYPYTYSDLQVSINVLFFGLSKNGPESSRKLFVIATRASVIAFWKGLGESYRFEIL